MQNTYAENFFPQIFIFPPFRCNSSAFLLIPTKYWRRNTNMIYHYKLLHIWIFYKIYKKCSRTNTTCSLQNKKTCLQTRILPTFGRIFKHDRPLQTTTYLNILQNISKNAHKKNVPIYNKIKNIFKCSKMANILVDNKYTL